MASNRVFTVAKGLLHFAETPNMRLLAAGLAPIELLSLAATA